jgi:Putative zinc-finger
VAALTVGFVAGRVTPAANRPVPPDLEVAEIQKLKCREARARFASLLDDKLSEKDRQAVLWHCAKCPSCLDAYYAARAQHKHEHPQHGDAAPVTLSRR